MKNKMKYFVLPLLFVLGSCTYGAYSFVNGEKEFNKTSISASYQEFNGYIARKFKVENNVYTFTFTCETLSSNEGKLSLEVKGSNSQIFNGLELLTEENNTFNFKLSFEGEYEVKIIGEKHQGSFLLSWVNE